jgi:hypothetical protein
MKIKTITLKGNGDFRSEESIQFLKESDIVVSNPPFSLFKEYIAQLMEHNKKFLVIGGINAVSYKNVFPLVKSNQLWLGVAKPKWYRIPDDREDFDVNKPKFKEEDGIKYQCFGNHVWYTNMEHFKRNDTLDTGMKYYGNEEDYPKYDNYDAINVNKVKEIPINYESNLGVPISFLEKWNPNQFEILGQMATTKITEDNFGYPYLNGKKKYARLIIKRK